MVLWLKYSTVLGRVLHFLPVTWKISTISKWEKTERSVTGAILSNIKQIKYIEKVHMEKKNSWTKSQIILERKNKQKG